MYWTCVLFACAFFATWWTAGGIIMSAKAEAYLGTLIFIGIFIFGVPWVWNQAFMSIPGW